jgi:hypothetical protein
MSYHALLDWRLARDLLEVLRLGRLTLDTETIQRPLVAWSHGYDATVLPGVEGAARFAHPRLGDHVVIVRHPLEASESAYMADRLAVAMAQAEIDVPGTAGVVFIDSFTLDRDPARVFQLCEAIAVHA